jgi:hypothetical protein
VAEDVGAGGTDPYGAPLSFSRKSILAGTSPDGVTRTIVDGSFKVPQLRNVALTPPYFHNGRLFGPASGAGVLPARW